MNSKLRDTLSDIIRLKLSIPLTTETLLQGKVTDNLYKIEAEAEQAIRKAVASEMLELAPRNAYKTSDGQVPESFEAPAHAYDVAVSDYQNAIKEWATLKGDTNE